MDQEQHQVITKQYPGGAVWLRNTDDDLVIPTNEFLTTADANMTVEFGSGAIQMDKVLEFVRNAPDGSVVVVRANKENATMQSFTRDDFQ